MTRSPRLAVALLAVSSLALLAPTAHADGSGDLAAVAAANGMPTAELARVLRDDPTARLDADSRLYFVEPTDSRAPSIVEGVAPFPLDQTFLLHSRPASTHVIYLDFDGGTVSGTAWNSSGLPNGTFTGYSLDGSAAFNDTEKEQIQSVWQRVAEDYATFDVDVTTQDPGDAAIDRTNAADQAFGTRAMITDDSTASSALCPSGCGGIAYIGVFDDAGSSHASHQPAWVFGHMLASNDTKDIAEATAHEVGHNLGLSHDGTTASTSGCSNLGYYCGHAMWAPIMGVGYQKPVVQWSKGEYSNANNTQDDLSVIAGTGAPVIADEAGGTLGTAAAGLPGKAFITSAADTDVYALGNCSGALSLGAAGALPSPDLDVRLDLLDSSGAVVATDNPVSAYVGRDSASGLSASISATVANGTYYARVDGVGNGTGAAGYSDYASIGAYTLTASGCTTVGAPTVPTNLQVAADPTGTSATVTWQVPSSNGGSAVTGYTVGRTGASPVDQVALTKTWTGLTPGATYLFTVAAKNSVGTGPAASSSVTMPTAPGQPTSVQVVPAANGLSATVTWSPPGSNGGTPVTGYHLSRTGAADVDLGLVGSYTWTGLTPGSGYTFGVAAKNVVGTGSAASQAATQPTLPGTPGGATATSSTDGRSVTLTWTTPGDGGSPLLGYDLSRDGVPGLPVSVGLVDSYTWTGLQPGTSHTFTVAARNAVGDGVAAHATVTTFTVPDPPAAPAVAKGAKGGRPTVKVSWTAPAADGGLTVTGYRVLVYRVGSTTPTRPRILGAGRTTWTFKGAKAAYRFAVVALNGAGESLPSAPSRQVKAR